MSLRSADGDDVSGMPRGHGVLALAVLDVGRSQQRRARKTDGRVMIVDRFGMHTGLLASARSNTAPRVANAAMVGVCTTR